MGTFQKKSRHEVTAAEEDAATMAVQPAPKPNLSQAQWKKARKKEKKDRAEALAAQKANRSHRIDVLVYHRTANSASANAQATQNAYRIIPKVVDDDVHQRTLHEAAGARWSTAKIAVKGIFGGLGKTKPKTKPKA